MGAKDVSVLNLALDGEEIIVPNCSLYCKYKLSRFVNIQFFCKEENGQVLKCDKSGSAKANRREPKSCLGRVFNFKLDHFVMYAMVGYIQKHTLA